MITTCLQKTILIVDDSPEDREAYRRYLSGESDNAYQIVEAELGSSVCALYEQFQPDIVLLDYNLPDRDGLKVLGQLKERKASLPVIILTGQGDETIAVQAIKQGAEDYLVKGHLTSHKLRLVVQNALENVELRQDRLSLIKREQEALQAAERERERYELAAAAVNCLIYDWDAQTQVVTRSQAIEPLLGYTPEEAGTELNWWRDQIHPDDFPRVDAESTKSLAESNRFVIEYRVRHRDGHYIWVLDHGIALRNSEGMIVRVVGSTRDITKRKHSEVVLETALRKLNFHVENSPLAVIEWDEQFRVCRWSMAAEQMFGWRAEEVMGKGPFDWQFIYEEDVTSVRAVMTQFRDGMERRKMSSNRNYRKDGTVVHCEWYNSTLTDEFGQLISVLSLVQNVSDRVQLEAERDRILQLEQDARAEAEAANQAKDDFIAVVSHELRSPLNSLLGWTKLIRMGRIDAEMMPQALQAIERGAQAQVQIVDDLLDISRMIRGKLNLTFTPFNLISVIQTAISLARPAAEAKRIHLKQGFESSLSLFVSGDSQRIQQVLGNLLTNAIKFTPPGGKVTVSVEQLELPYLAQSSEARSSAEIEQLPYPFSLLPTPRYAKITITDTGKGISAELLPHIFDRFRQDKRIAGKAKDGLGLGLAIVQQLVEMHQGKVWAESPGEGLGATFSILLPLIREVSQVESVEFITTSATSLSQLGASGIRILVVDDDPDIGDFLKFALENQGAIVSVGITAQRGVELFSSFKPNLIISDIGMPGEDGYTFLQRIRALEMRQGEPIPAIALTAFTQPEIRESVMAAGYQLYLTKPIEPDDLVEAISSLLRNTN